MRTIIYAILVFDMCICAHSFVYPVYIMIDIHCVYIVRIYPKHAVFEYNNLNIVDRAVKIRGKYFRGVNSDGEFHDTEGKGVEVSAE